MKRRSKINIDHVKVLILSLDPVIVCVSALNYNKLLLRIGVRWLLKRKLPANLFFKRMLPWGLFKIILRDRKEYQPNLGLPIKYN